MSEPKPFLRVGKMLVHVRNITGIIEERNASGDTTEIRIYSSGDEEPFTIQGAANIRAFLDWIEPQAEDITPGLRPGPDRPVANGAKVIRNPGRPR